MKIYPILSSDLYALSCVPVSMLERIGTDELRAHLDAGGSMKFLVAQETMGYVDTATGYMSKHVEYGDLSATLARDMNLPWIYAETRQLSDFVKKLDLDDLVVKIDSLPQPYIVSSFHLSSGHLKELEGYALSAALAEVVPRMKYRVFQANSASFDDIDAPIIASISAKIPDSASSTNQLADREYVQNQVRTNASNFRGTFSRWSDVPTTASQYEADQSDRRTPNYNDHIVVRETSSLVSDGGTWPESVNNNEKRGTWLFGYRGVWSSDGAAAKKNWQPEYRIDRYNFTDDQMAATQSGVTRSNRVIKQSDTGSKYRGIYVAGGDGVVHAMDYSLSASVPADAKFTETKVCSGVGTNVNTSQLGNTISAWVDVAASVEVVSVEANDTRTPEQLVDAGKFGSPVHPGAIMIVKRGYGNEHVPESYTGYVYTTSGEWAAMAGNYSADNVILPRDISFSGSWQNVGNIERSAGTFQCAGKSVSQAFGMIFGSES